MKRKQASFLVYVSCGMMLMEKSDKHGGLHILGGKTEDADFGHSHGLCEYAKTTLIREVEEEVGVRLPPFSICVVDRRDVVHDGVLWTETYFRAVRPIDALESLWHPAVLWVPIETTEPESCATEAGRHALELTRKVSWILK